MVLAISLFVAVYLSVFDYGFTQGLRAMLEHSSRFTGQSAIEVNTETPSDGTTTETTNTDGETLPEFTATPVVDESSN